MSWSKAPGHHHLLINVNGTPKGQTVPADAQHLHFGKGQTETELKLAPGSYYLWARLGSQGRIMNGLQPDQRLPGTGVRVMPLEEHKLLQARASDSTDNSSRVNTAVATDRVARLTADERRIRSCRDGEHATMRNA